MFRCHGHSHRRCGHRKVTGDNDADNRDHDCVYKTISWFSGKHWCFGRNLRVLSNCDGRPLYIAPVGPEATHDITTAKKCFFDAVWAAKLWIFADKGYQDSGVRAKNPPKGNRFNPDDETIRETITDIKASIEDGTRH